MAIKVTPGQVAAQWGLLKHVFNVNAWNFEVEASKAAVSTFRGSFDMHRLNSQGSTPWPPRKKQPKPYHPMLKETGTLKNSITAKVDGRWSLRGGRHLQAHAYTDHRKFGSAARHKGFCYAAVHNSPDGSGFRTGRATGIAQRQFIGHSTVLDNELQKLTHLIFRGFPITRKIPNTAVAVPLSFGFH